MLDEVLLPQVLAFALAFSRLAGFVVTSPFPGDAIPRTARVGLVVVLAFLVASFAAAPVVPLRLDLSILPHVIRETGIGIVVGFTFRLSLICSVIAGETIANTIGLSSATLFNPAIGAQDTVIARMFSLFAMLVVLSTGMHRVVLSWMLDSFSAIPIGSLVRIEAAMPVFLDLFARCVDVGLRLAMPVVAVSLLVQSGLAVIARVAPTLQVFNVGFALFLATGLLTLMLSFRSMMAWFADHLGQLPDWLDRVLLEVLGGG